VALPSQAEARNSSGNRQRATLSMQRHDERELREMLVQLRAEHRQLDDEIIALETSTMGDQLSITRLKKRKLKLKDQITAIEDRLFPDIIA
jgi:hypothetical protein